MRIDSQHRGPEARVEHSQTIHTTDGVVVRWDVLRATTSVLVPILIDDGSHADWQVSTIDMLAQERSSRVKAVQFSPRGGGAGRRCSGAGVIPAGTRCELLVSIPDPAQYAGLSISLLLSDARGEPTAMLTGIQM